MKKLDLKQVFRGLYTARAGEVVLVEVPRLKYLMSDGVGDPHQNEQFQRAVGALYAVAYTLKFTLKKGRPPQDYTVMPLEGLWWCAGSATFRMERRDDWLWTLMILEPEFVTPHLLGAAIERVRLRHPGLDVPVRLDEFQEGQAVQSLHVGPYASEGPALDRMQAFAQKNGYAIAGKHHEIYLGDPRRVAPEKLRTILRQPVRRMGAVAACA